MKLDCENNYCETQAAKGKCNKGWMKLRCKKACGLCKYNITLKPIFHDLGTYSPLSVIAYCMLFYFRLMDKHLDLRNNQM